MKLYKEASLMMLPTSVKDGKLYSIFPQDGSGDFTFSRGSNLAATRINEQGLIEKGRENLLLQSNQFDTTWGDDGGTITNGFKGYDGTNDAWKYTKQGQFDGINQSVSVSGVHTVSLYLKLPDGETDVDSVLFRLDYSGGNTNIVFSLNDDSVPSVSGNGINAEKENIGNGWYRCSFTLNQSTTKVNFRPSLDTDTSGTSGSILIQDAQLEVGLVATDYIESGATTGKAGVLEDLPRLDWSGDCPSLLLEPQRTNLVTYSEDVDEYSNSNTICTPNYSLSPEGLNNSTKVRFISASTNSLGQNISVSNGDSVTQSIFVKYIDTQFVQLWFGSSGFAGGHANFDLINNQTSSYSGASSSIESFGNGWYRISTTKQASSSNSNTKGFALVAVDSLTSSRFNDEVDGSVEVFGAQSEVGSYPTSYIPTRGQAATRAYDFFENTNLGDYLGTGDATFFFNFDFDVVTREGSAPLYRVYNGAGNYFGIKGTSTVNRNLQLRAAGGFVNDVNITAAAANTSHKIIARVTGTLIEVFYNGTKLNDTMTGYSTYNWSELRVTADNAFLSKTKEITIFDKALSDNECINLTTI